MPGTNKAPEALRGAGLFQRLMAAGAVDGGVVLSGRYVDDDATRAAGQVRNEAALVDHARRLGCSIAGVIAGGRAPLVIGGDCSLVLGAGLALRRGAGLVHIDGHTDFRHPCNSDQCASVAGEDLAAAVGEHWPAVADIDGLRPYFLPARTVHIGCREDDEHFEEVRRSLGLTLPARTSIGIGMSEAARAARAVAGHAGYWLHLDVDVLDPIFMPAVDSPEPGGLNPDQLVSLLMELAPTAIGAQVTVFDPDLDPDGRYAALLVDILATALADLGRKVHP